MACQDNLSHATNPHIGDPYHNPHKHKLYQLFFLTVFNDQLASLPYLFIIKPIVSQPTLKACHLLCLCRARVYFLSMSARVVYFLSFVCCFHVFRYATTWSIV